MNGQKYLKYLKQHKLKFGLSIEEVIASSILASLVSMFTEDQLIPFVTFFGTMVLIAIKKAFLEKNYTLNLMNYRQSFNWERVLDEKSLQKNRK
jgi:hypothetical protein